MRRVLTPYKEIFANQGAWGFSLAGVLTRMPMSMTALSIVLLIYGVTGSYGTAGSLVATYGVTIAIVAPRWSRRADRIGQTRVIRSALIFHVTGLLAIVTLVSIKSPSIFWYFATLLAAVFAVQTGSFVRRRWHFLLANQINDPIKERALINTAWSFESLMDEVIYIVGPIVATVLCTQVAPSAGLLAAIGFVLFGSLFLLTQKMSEPIVNSTEEINEKPKVSMWRNSTAINIAVLNLMLGMYFGAVEISTVAFCTERGAKSISGVLLALWAASSGISAIINGVFATKISAKRIFLIGYVVLMLSAPLLLLPNSVFQMGMALFCCGFAISPVLISAPQITAAAFNEDQMTEAISFISVGFPIGMSVGAMVTGHFIDLEGVDAALILPFLFMGIGVAFMLIRVRGWFGRS
jgi:MFS family permease